MWNKQLDCTISSSHKPQLLYTPRSRDSQCMEPMLAGSPLLPSPAGQLASAEQLGPAARAGSMRGGGLGRSCSFSPPNSICGHRLRTDGFSLSLCLPLRLPFLLTHSYTTPAILPPCLLWYIHMEPCHVTASSAVSLSIITGLADHDEGGLIRATRLVSKRPFISTRATNYVTEMRIVYRQVRCAGSLGATRLPTG